MSNERINLLYVEDEPDLRLVLDMTLKILDLEYTLVGSAEEALDAMKKNVFNIIVTDHYLPGMTGIELLEYIKNSNPTMKRFLITGAVLGSVFDEAEERAQPEYIFQKPVVVDEIISIVLKKL